MGQTVERVCQRCGKVFHPLACEVKRGNGKFCSRKCHKDSVELTCQECGTVFKRSRSEYERMKERGIGSIYCSRKCYRTTLTPIEERFWKKVNKTENCWLWTGANTGRKWPYGLIGLGRSNQHGTTTHRLSWEMHNGPISDGLFVCHKCDNTLCVRPDHLFLGTASDNTADMMLKNRCRAIKLTDDQVEEIRSKYDTGNFTQRALASEYKTSASNINLIVNKVTRWHRRLV